MTLTYHSYLNLNKLLSLQRPCTKPPQHDEYLFIIAHQTYELWFKLLLIEFRQINDALSGNRLWEALHTLKRVRTIVKILVQQMDVIETMTPLSFASFRAFLEHASGFQSVQFRELEFALGYKRPEIINSFPQDSVAQRTLNHRIDERSMVDHFYDFLEHQGVIVPTQLRQRYVREPAIGNEQVQEAILSLYKTRPDLCLLFELMVDFDEGLQEWRYRHIKVVERMIGSTRGTGSQNISSLKENAYAPVFADLWMVRNRLCSCH